MTPRTPKDFARRGAKAGAILAGVGWLLWLGAIVLSSFGLVAFMALANVMSAYPSPWGQLLSDTPRTWVDIFGDAASVVGASLLALSIGFTALGAVLGLAWGTLRSGR